MAVERIGEANTAWGRTNDHGMLMLCVPVVCAPCTFHVENSKGIQKQRSRRFPCLWKIPDDVIVVGLGDLPHLSSPLLQPLQPLLLLTAY